MFSRIIQQINWGKTTAEIYAKTSKDVERALTKSHCNIEDFKALISPTAENYIEDMALLANRYTRERFGATMNLFIPIYLTNSCTNSCVYCGFHRQNPMKRIILTESEIEMEFQAIKKIAPFENILLVTGENPIKAGLPYLSSAIKQAKKYFTNVKIEVMPLKAEEYIELISDGLNGVICFQETYNATKYKLYHPQGMKSNFEWRLDGFDRMGMSEIQSIGLGVLIGLEDWRTDITMMAYHLRYLEQNYWKTKYSVNFPRLRPAKNGGFQPNVIMSDRQLAQATMAMRIFDHDVDISYSTREPAFIRDGMMHLGVTTMSAESRTDPGGYATYPTSLTQFDINDNRTISEILEVFKRNEIDAVWKDWDCAFDSVSKEV